MSWRATALLAAAIAFGGACAQPARAEGTLTVCLNGESPPYSMHHGKESGGFDLAVADAVAKRLGRTLAVQWYESEREEDTSLKLEANALLSEGLCQLVAGFPLVKDALGKPGVDAARLPDYEGRKPGDRRRRVKIGTLVASNAYHHAPLTVVLGAAAASKRITGLADLQGLRLDVEGGTLTDAILMVFDDGRLVNQITHLVPGRGELLQRLEAGDFDATLIQLHRFDVYRAEHPDTKLVASGYYHRIGFNMGFVGLSTQTALIEEVNKAIGDLLEKGELPALAREAGMTYLPPRKPDVLEGLSYADLQSH